MNIDFRPICLLMELQGGQVEVEVWGSGDMETMFIVQHSGWWYLFAGWNGNGWNRYYVIESMIGTPAGGIRFTDPNGLMMDVRKPYQRVFSDQVTFW